MKTIFTTEEPGVTPTKYEADSKVIFPFNPQESIALHGDLHFVVKHKGKLGNIQTIFRTAVHTSFVQNNYAVFNKYTVSPDSIQKDKRFAGDFCAEIFFDNVCATCRSDTDIDQICVACHEQIAGEFEHWKKIKEIV